MTENVESRDSSTSTSWLKKSSLLDRFVDQTSDKEKAVFDKKLARAIIASGCPLRMVENEYWHDFFNVVRPSYSLPTRHDLSNKLLDEEFESVLSDVTVHIKNADFLSLQCDGWSNIRNEAVINFVVNTPKPVLFKTMTTGTESHTGEYVAEEMIKCITEIGADKMFAVLSDNAAAMEKAKKLITEKFNHITAYSCASHTLNLLVGDIMKLTSLQNVESHCKGIIKDITGSHKNLATFNKIQKEKYGAIRSLKLPIKTRWGSILKCIESLINCKEALQILIISQGSEGLKFSKSTKDHILDNDIFWIKLEKIRNILQPIVKWITILEGDQQIFSHVYIAVKEIECCLKSKVNFLPINSKEETELVSLFEKRKKMLLKPLHLAAYLLDQHFCGIDLTAQEHVEAMQYIDQVTSNHPRFKEYKEIISLELTNYLAKTDIWDLTYVWETAKKVECITWWKGICCKTKLKDLAIVLLGLPASSAATERSFSTYSFLHCKKRNRLTTERAGKLLYISHNLKLLREHEQTKIHANNNSDAPLFHTCENPDLGEGTSGTQKKLTLQNPTPVC